MYKKFVLITITFMLMIISCGCRLFSGDATEMERIQKQLLDMEGYKCSATLKRISNKGENTYETKQCYKSTGEYRLELTSPEAVAGNYTVFDGSRICQYNPKLKNLSIMYVDDSQPRNELFLGQFIKNYMLSEEVSVYVDNMAEGKATVLEAVIPGGNKYLATEKLWVDNETLEPVQFIIYDANGQERYIIIYNDFEYTGEFDEGTFSIPEA